MSKQSPVMRLTSIHLMLLLIGFGVTARAQQFTGTLQGTVQDSTGAVVSGAEVSVTNQATNVTINTTTGSNGHYTVPQLPPGVYRVTVKKSGFKTATVADIKIDVQQIRATDVTLEVGQTTETVSVSASGTSAIQTTSSTFPHTINTHPLLHFPPT